MKEKDVSYFMMYHQSLFNNKGKLLTQYIDDPKIKVVIEKLIKLFYSQLDNWEIRFKVCELIIDTLALVPREIEVKK